MTSEGSADPLDLARDLPTTAADTAALRRAAAAATPVADLESYLRFLAGLEPPRPEARRRRPGPRGAPFRLA
jgi:hypothetical protein